MLSQQSIECLWCCEPTHSSDVLCAECRAVNDHPPFHCTVPGHTVPTLGPRCAECEQIEWTNKRRREANAPRIAELQAILNRHMEGWYEPWPGCEYAKSWVGNMILSAIRDLGGDATIPPPGKVHPMTRLLADDPVAYQAYASATLAARKKV